MRARVCGSPRRFDFDERLADFPAAPSFAPAPAFLPLAQLMLFAAVIVCLMGIMYQANSSSSFYPGALDGVTAVVMIDIIVAIIYYFTVLFSEIAILYNEDNKRVQLEKAARARGGKAAATDSSASKTKSLRDASSGRLVDEASGEINTGRLETNTNPLFLNSGGDGARAGGGAGGAGGLRVDVVLAQRTPPPAELWTLVRFIAFPRLADPR